MPTAKKEAEKKTIRKTKPAISKAVSELTLITYDILGQEKEGVELPKEIFAAPINKNLLVQYVHVYLTNQRQGTVSTKTRGEVIGSTRKIYRQKGTGRARHGDIKAPIFVGGGVVGGPKPRNYSLKLNKKQKKQALFSALSLKNKDKAIIGLNSGALKMEPKTKVFVAFLKKLEMLGDKIMLVLPKMEKNNLIFAARNIKELILVDAVSLNAYDVLKSEKIILVGESVDAIKKHFLKTK